MFRNECLKLPEGFDSNEPITIRGHHLINYFLLYQRYVNEITFLVPKNKAAKVASRIHAESTSKQIFPLLGRTPYSVDVYGNTEESENKYRQELAATSYHFLTSKKNHKVKIIVETPDDICLLCRSGINKDGTRMGGEHCKIPTNGDDAKVIREFFGENSQDEFTTTTGHLKNLFREKMQKDYLKRKTT